MSVTAIGSNNISDTYAANTTAKDKTTAASKAEDTQKATGATAEASVEKAETKNDNANTAAVYDKSKLSADDRKAIVAQLKADQEKRQTQLTDLVHDMLSKQTNAFGKANNIWKFLAKGEFTVDEETKKKAQEDISEDGYWGVKQTSDRIVEFATALAGDDSAALEKMRDAFLKGYKQAEKTWGGKLPEISQKTYDAVMEKFDKLLKPEESKESEQKNTETVTSTEDGTVITKTE